MAPPIRWETEQVSAIFQSTALLPYFGGIWGLLFNSSPARMIEPLDSCDDLSADM